MSLLRVFVSIDMPESVQQEVARIQRELKRLDLFYGSFVKPEMAHLTLNFIGYIEPSFLSKIKGVLKDISFQPIKVRLGSVGSFGEGPEVRVIWLDLISPEIAQLAHKIEDSLAKALKVARVPSNRTRTFQSHITIARVKITKDAVQLREALSRILVSPTEFTIVQFKLKQSILTAQGPVHIDLASY